MKFLKRILVLILTTILFISTSSILFLLPLKHTISKDSIKETITNIDIENIIKENPKVEEELNEAFKPIYDTAQDFGISEDVVNKLINSEEVKGLIGDFTGNIVDYVFTGENQKIVSENEIGDLVGNAIDKINESGYYEFKPNEKENILEVVKDTVSEYQDFLPDTKVIDDAIESNPETKIIFQYARIIVSDKLLTYLIITTIISCLLILFLNLKEGKWIKSIAITILIASITTTIGAILILGLGNLIELESTVLVMDILHKTLNYSLTLSITTCIIMIAILIFYSIIHKSILKNKEEIAQ